MKRLKRYSKHLLAAFFVFAGVNHFIMPDFYLGLIPPYFPAPEAINVVSGVLEILGGLGLWIPRLQRWAAWGLFALLLAFIPAHVYFLQIGSCVENSLCVPEWVSWARLLVIHPMLLAWVWWHRD